MAMHMILLIDITHIFMMNLNDRSQVFRVVRAQKYYMPGNGRVDDSTDLHKRKTFIHICNF